jgi:hypothetical protein
LNVVTSIFLSSKTPKELEYRQRQTRMKIPHNTDRFSLLLARARSLGTLTGEPRL